MSSSLGHSFRQPTTLDVGRRWVHGMSCRVVPSRGNLQRDTGQPPLPQEAPLSQMGEGSSVSSWGKTYLGAPMGVGSCLLPQQGWLCLQPRWGFLQNKLCLL